MNSRKPSMWLVFCVNGGGSLDCARDDKGEVGMTRGGREDDEGEEERIVIN